MQIQYDFSRLVKFADGLQDTHNFDTALMTATQNIARVLHKNLLKYTPIDTGNLRKMWSAGDNLRFTVDRVSNGFEVTMINTARNGHKDGFMYGVAVNDGHKTPGGTGWVMGRFFVEKAVVQTGNSAQLERLIMKELQKWWRGV